MYDVCGLWLKYLNIFQFWIAIGNQRPAVMEKIERTLWYILLGTINDPETLPTLLQDAMETIDMAELQRLEEFEVKFFQAGMDINILLDMTDTSLQQALRQ
jgi:ABC-type anion transport system duplicated permease subunit